MKPEYVQDAPPVNFISPDPLQELPLGAGYEGPEMAKRLVAVEIANVAKSEVRFVGFISIEERSKRGATILSVLI